MTYYSIIKRFAVGGVAVVGLAAFSVTVARAQSSGNFTAAVQTTQCTMNTMPGVLDAGRLNPGGGTVLESNIQTPNSKFTTLLIRPSLVTGLFTNTGANSDEYSGNSAAVKVYVTLDGIPVAPATSGEPGIIYDQRFQQLGLADMTNMTTCTANNNCDVSFVVSTLAAHSFDFVAPNVGGGNHHLKVEWKFECTDNTGAVVQCTTAYTANTAGACAGPGSVTVTQVKNFSQNSPIVIAP